MLRTLYGYLSRLYLFYFLIFLSIVACIIGLFEVLDFVQKYLAKTASDPMIIFWRCLRHIHQFFPYLLFVVFAYTMRMLIQSREFYTLQNLGFSVMIWIKTALLLIAILFLLYYFAYTPVQRLAYDLSFKPDNALNSSLLAPSGLWLLEKESITTCHPRPHFRGDPRENGDEDLSLGGTMDPHFREDDKTPVCSMPIRFIKACSYDKTTQTLQDVQTLEISPNASPQFTTQASQKFQLPLDFNVAKQDYFPFINTQEKINILKRTGFSTVEYSLIWHKGWFLPVYWLGLAILGFLFAYTIKSNIYFFLGLLGCAIALFFAYEMAMSFVMAEKIGVLVTLMAALVGLYSLCGGYHVVYMRYRR